MFRRIKINNRTRIGGTTGVMPSEPIRKSPTGFRAFLCLESGFRIRDFMLNEVIFLQKSIVRL